MRNFLIPVATREVYAKRVEWIRLFGEDKTAKEIAEALVCSRGAVYAMVKEHNLIIKADPLSRHKTAQTRYSEGTFNVHARENWMI